MSKLLQKLTKFFSIKDSVSTGLDAYITGKNPQSVAEAEQLAQRYLNRGICGRTL
jgi:hypothetical protein